MTNIENRSEYVNYRIETAYTTYEAAKVLAENGFWNSAVNRLYYALYYAVDALLFFSLTFSKQPINNSSIQSINRLKGLKKGVP